MSKRNRESPVSVVQLRMVAVDYSKIKTNAVHQVVLGLHRQGNIEKLFPFN